MRKLRVGVWISKNGKPENGGSYSYYSELLEALKKYPFKNAEVIFLSDEKIFFEFPAKILKEKSGKMKIFNLIWRNIAQYPVPNILKERMRKAIDKSKRELYQYADVVYYLTPGCAYPDFPYIYTLWDIGHLNTYAFPEVSMNGIFESRKKHHNFFPHKALMVFAESETGKNQYAKYLNINEERIRVVPIFPSGVASSKCTAKKPKKMRNGDPFIHYPAQYWAHKNHYNLLVAMVPVIKNFPGIKLVFTGSDKGNKKYILETISELGLEKSVVDLGFVSLKELRWLYENSLGLVMPTLLGPTNMPLLEAAELGCPVACTNLPGHVEQLGDYGYYFDGLNPEDIAEKIITMVNDGKKGTTKKYNSRFNIGNTLESLDRAFTELRHIRFCWDRDDKPSSKNFKTRAND